MSRILKTGNNQITQNYASHKAKVDAKQGWAIGTDIVKSKNSLDTIIAHSTGTVIKVIDYLSGTNFQLDKEGMGYGNYVMILHQNNVVTLYAHLEKVYVKEGQTIAKGVQVGYMGNTGNSYGAHLHFEVRKYQVAPTKTNLHDNTKFSFLNPELYLDTELPNQTSGSGAQVKGDRYICYDANGKRVASYNNKDLGINYAKKINGTLYDTVTKQNVYPVKVELTATSYPDYQPGSDNYYRLAKGYENKKYMQQLGAWYKWSGIYNNWYSSYKNEGYHIYDTNGIQLD